MPWTILFHEMFDPEFRALAEGVQDSLLAKALLVSQLGPQLGRPHADTLKASKHKNMKELRFAADNGIWRVAFAFDEKRNAILLLAGDKSGVNEKRFYSTLISKADQRFDQHLEKQKGRK